MAPFCTIHAFDCTITEEEPSVKDQDFAFHQICIGNTQGALIGPTWVKDNRTLVFNSLQEVMKDLGHDQIDYLKFDVEDDYHSRVIEPIAKVYNQSTIPLL